MGKKVCPVILPTWRLYHTIRDLLHGANLRHGTDGFTSPPKEGALRIFSPLKIRRFRPGVNPRTWILKASMLPLGNKNYLATSPCYRLKFNKNDNIKIGILFAELLKYVETHKVVFWYVRPYGRVNGHHQLGRILCKNISRK